MPAATVHSPTRTFLGEMCMKYDHLRHLCPSVASAFLHGPPRRSASAPSAITVLVAVRRHPRPASRTGTSLGGLPGYTKAKVETTCAGGETDGPGVCVAQLVHPVAECACPTTICVISGAPACGSAVASAFLHAPRHGFLDNGTLRAMLAMYIGYLFYYRAPSTALYPSASCNELRHPTHQPAAAGRSLPCDRGLPRRFPARPAAAGAPVAGPSAIERS